MKHTTYETVTLFTGIDFYYLENAYNDFSFDFNFVEFWLWMILNATETF